MKKCRVLAILLAIMVLVSLLAGCGSSNNGGTSTNSGNEPSGDTKVTLVLSHYESMVSTTGKALDAWAKEITESSNGSIVVDVMGGGALGSEHDALELVKSGAADITMCAPALFNNMFPYVQIIQSPMLGVSSAEVGTDVLWDAYAQYTEAYDAMFAAQNLKVLMMFSTPSSVIGSTKPIHSVSDMKGMRLRATAGLISDICTAWGAAPVTLGQGEIYDAMEKNAIDGHINVWSAMGPFKFYEVGKYAVSLDLFVNPIMVVMGLDQWNALSAEQQELLMSVSGRSGSQKHMAAAMAANGESGLEACKENGVEIYYPTEEEIAGFEAAAPGVVNSWLEENSSDRMDMFELYDFFKSALEKY